MDPLKCWSQWLYFSPRRERPVLKTGRRFLQMLAGKYTVILINRCSFILPAFSIKLFFVHSILITMVEAMILLRYCAAYSMQLFQALGDGMCCFRKNSYRKYREEGGGPKGCNLRWCWEWLTLGTRGFSRVRLEFSVLVEGRHIFGRRKPLARSSAFYRPCRPLSFFIGLHLRQSD